MKLFRRVLLLVLLCAATPTFSQTILAPGDMAFLSFKWSNDGFAVVTFKKLCPGTIIYFTDNPYRNSGGFCTSQEEFCIGLTVTTAIPAGAQISYSDGAPGSFTIAPSGSGTIAFAFNGQAGTNNGFSNGDDNCFVFQGTYANPTFICGFKTSAFTASGSVTCSNRGHTELPSSLTVGTNCVIKSPGGNDGAFYNCSVTSGTTAALQAAINNSANWTTGNSAITVPCSFTVSDAPSDPCTVSCTCNIWSEDFNTTRYPSRATTGANSNTANPAADWTTTALDCDDATPFGTNNQSWWGTDAGSFKVNDIEGGPCGCTTGGTTLNEWVTEVIDISAYTNVTVCFNYASSGTLEPGTSVATCNNADDIIQGQYRINSGAWANFFYDDGPVNFSQATVTGLSGSTLQIRIYLGNKANDEFYTFDNVCVSGTLSTLPVSLVAFNAMADDENHAQLYWATGSETNCNYFSIQKSTDGAHWLSIGEVAGNGTTSVPHSYSFYDDEMLTGETYYRLRQVDYDGAAYYSPIRSVAPDAGMQLTVMPNPASDFVIISGLPETMVSTISFYDCAGKLVMEKQSYGPVETVDVSMLNSGLYMVTICTGQRAQHFRIICEERN